MKQLDWEPGCFWAEAFKKFVSSIIISENDEYEILLELIPLYLVISNLRFYLLLNKLEEYEAPLCTVGFQALSPSLHDFLAGADGSTEWTDPCIPTVCII